MEIKTRSLNLGDKIDEKAIDAIMALSNSEKMHYWKRTPAGIDLFTKT